MTKYSNSFTQKVSTESSKVWNYLRLSEAPIKADAIFIVGEPSIAPVTKAIELWEQGYAQIITFVSYGGTYGVMKEWGMSEAEKYHQVLTARGIPQLSIVFESLTTNTLEEAKEAIHFLEKTGHDSRKIILVAIPVHQRRVYATFYKQNPGVKFINCPAEIPFSSGDSEMIKRLVGETDRLLEYGERGDLEKQVIPEDISKAVGFLKRYLKNQQ